MGRSWRVLSHDLSGTGYLGSSLACRRVCSALALYFVNYNGHYGTDRFRDYLLEMKPCTHSMEQLKPYANAPPDWEKQPTLARARVQNFWGANTNVSLSPARPILS